MDGAGEQPGGVSENWLDAGGEDGSARTVVIEEGIQEMSPGVIAEATVGELEGFEVIQDEKNAIVAEKLLEAWEPILELGGIGEKVGEGESRTIVLVSDLRFPLHAEVAKSAGDFAALFRGAEPDKVGEAADVLVVEGELQPAGGFAPPAMP